MEVETIRSRAQRPWWFCCADIHLPRHGALLVWLLHISLEFTYFQLLLQVNSCALHQPSNLRWTQSVPGEVYGQFTYQGHLGIAPLTFVIAWHIFMKSIWHICNGGSAITSQENERTKTSVSNTGSVGQCVKVWDARRWISEHGYINECLCTVHQNGQCCSVASLNASHFSPVVHRNFWCLRILATWIWTLPASTLQMQCSLS